MTRRFTSILGLAAASVLMLGLAAVPLAQAKDLPKTTHDGMDLVPHTEAYAVYMKPGVNLKTYTRVGIMLPAVAFQKDWQKDYNDEAPMNAKVTDADMERIKTELADEFVKVFAEELTKTGHQVTKETGKDVVVLRPMIVNLEVTSPDMGAAGVSRGAVASAGQMTLILELYDSVTSDIIARIIDMQAAREQVGFHIASAASNKADADLILRGWAARLAKHLGEVEQGN
jgi:hypothetical protein